MFCLNIEIGIGCIILFILFFCWVIWGVGSSVENGVSGGSMFWFGFKFVELMCDWFCNLIDVGFSLIMVKGWFEDKWEWLEDEGKLLSFCDD